MIFAVKKKGNTDMNDTYLHIDMVDNVDEDKKELVDDEPVLLDEDGNVIEDYVSEEEHGEHEEYSTTALTDEELEEHLNEPEPAYDGYKNDEEPRG